MSQQTKLSTTSIPTSTTTTLPPTISTTTLFPTTDTTITQTLPNTIYPPTTTTTAVTNSRPSGSESDGLITDLNRLTSPHSSTILALTIHTATQTLSSSIISSLPSGLPLIIEPEHGIPTPPTDSVLIQLGWAQSLNYTFIVGNQGAAQQFFDLIPIGVSYGLNITSSTVVMQYLQPFNSLATGKGYITTLSMLYIPSNSATTLSQAMLNPVSLLFTNPNALVKSFMNLLDPNFPVLAGTITTNNSSSTTVDPAIVTDPAVVASSSIETLWSPATTTASMAPPSTGGNPSQKSKVIPAWGIAILVIGVVVGLVLLSYVIWYRKRVTRRTHQPIAELDTSRRSRVSSFIHKWELPASLGAMSKRPDPQARVGALRSKAELETTANRHELEGSNRYKIRHQPDTVQHDRCL